MLERLLDENCIDLLLVEPPNLRQAVPERGLIVLLERAAVELPLGRRLHLEDPMAAPGLAILPCALLTVLMPDVVGVPLVGVLLHRHPLAELALPELHRVLQSQANALEEQPELEPPEMLEMVRLQQPQVLLAHAHREGA